MALFQTSVLKSHLALLNQVAVDKAYKMYQKYFWNTTIQENIKSAKEEQYQATFLNELFVNILGYTLFPNPKSNLTTEFKNEKNARKADGAILKDRSAIGVIELKGTNTKDLESIRRQAFDYKANQKGCIYVITSNFEKLRFYINDATEFEEFDLFTLSHDRFKLLYLCLHIDSILNNTSLKIKEASIAEEEEITKAFYKDYSVFKRELFRDLVRNNSKTVKAKLSANIDADEQLAIARLEKNVKLTLFKKSQKLIDRFLFIFFAEDRMLLPSNSTLQILKKWKNDQDFGDERPLYDLFKQYFNFLDTGRIGTQNRAEIYAYNGGLFKPDAILDAVEIDSDLLYKYTLSLSNYDFESQVDVNILGHIFENSLNEIESVSSEIEGGEFDKQTSKRKKDGVFYTPKYITKYIVENTVGKLCVEKKTELGFREEEYFKGRKNRNKATIVNLVNILDAYRDWLLQLTICDPACGSGAFLNQALDFLIKEHNYVDELKTKILGGGLQFSDIENTILENNIYGVDLNEESVEIAKLSLWLRTAQPRRKLNDLSSNVKCGNSLIEDKKVAGDKAFTWENEFPDVFEKGGFDVVIGNPPYVRQELFKEIKPYLETRYKTYHSSADLYTYFFEVSIDNLMKPDGIYSIIVGNKWMHANYAKRLRIWLKDKPITEIINFGDLEVFKNVSAYPCIITINKNKSNGIINVLSPTSLESIETQLANQNRLEVSIDSLDANGWNLIDRRRTLLFEKLSRDGISFDDFFGNVYRGLITGLNEAFVIDKVTRDRIIESNPNSSDRIKPFLAGRDIKRYGLDFSENYLILFPSGWTNLNRGESEPWEFIRLKFPAIANHLKKFESKAMKRYDKGDYWWELRSCKYYDDFESKKIIYPNICNEPSFTFDINKFYTNQKCFIIPEVNESILGVLNSKVMMFLFELSLPRLRGGYFEPSYIHLKNIPLPEITKEIEPSLNKYALKMLMLKSDFKSLIDNFIKYFRSNYCFTKVPRKLQSWHEISFSDFIKELNKAIKTTNKLRAAEDLALVPELTKKDEFEWMELFEENMKKAQELQTQIATTEKEIDQMVYELYGLSEAEIAIVENIEK